MIFSDFFFWIAVGQGRDVAGREVHGVEAASIGAASARPRPRAPAPLGPRPPAELLFGRESRASISRVRASSRANRRSSSLISSIAPLATPGQNPATLCVNSPTGCREGASWNLDAPPPVFQRRDSSPAASHEREPRDTSNASATPVTCRLAQLGGEGGDEGPAASGSLPAPARQVARRLARVRPSASSRARRSASSTAATRPARPPPAPPLRFSMPRLSRQMRQIILTMLWVSYECFTPDDRYYLGEVPA